jgi:hypothetical protein
MMHVRNKILTVTFYAAAMAFLETTVVIYLRELYYPEGFGFPLKSMDFFVGKVEFFRELATLVMIFTVSVLAGKTFIQKFSAFIYVFAVWDIFYYVFLYVALGWPSSLQTWDVLFLIPVMWAGPVLAPVINSLTMILLAGVLLYAEKRNFKKILLRRDWFLLITGSLIVIISYTEDFVGFLMKDAPFGKLSEILYSEKIIQRSMLYVPDHFAWFIFGIGLVFHLAAISDVFLRIRKIKN